MNEYRETSLWTTAFLHRENDKHKDARLYFSAAYERFREKVIPLVNRISTDIPSLTLHDISHLDALWETASEIAGDSYSLNPAEAFVFGGAVLLHDAAMCAAAYKGGMAEIKTSPAWRDCAVPLLRKENHEPGEEEILNPGKVLSEQILFSVLRDQHAAQASKLATMSWPDPDGATGEMFLIDNPELRLHYGEQIGQIAHSHHWDIAQLADGLQREVPAIALSTLSVPSSWAVDCIKVACLLRTADAAHIDARRAPRQYRIFSRPAGVSAEHWRFQERLGKARFDAKHSSLRYGSGKKFSLSDADAWWLCFDTVQMVDRELSDAQKLLASFDIPPLAAKAVLDAETPSLLAKHVQTIDWTPVDARIRISDVGAIVQKFGGGKLYGDDPSIAVRELIQNAADSIRARRRVEENPELGRISLGIRKDAEAYWLDVEDDGIGMSEGILTTTLLDFGKSLWRSEDLRREWPGLAGSSFKPTGRFGVGFFSVFMLGDQVSVTSRRFDQGVDKAKTLEFRQGLSFRPILKVAEPTKCVLHGGTRVSVKLKNAVHVDGEIFRKHRYFSNKSFPTKLAILAGWLAPMLDADIWVREFDAPEVQVISRDDWMVIPAEELLNRTHFPGQENTAADRVENLVGEDGHVYGRGALSNQLYHSSASTVCVGGLRADSEEGFVGVFEGVTDQLSRNHASLAAPVYAIHAWLKSQEEKIAKLDLDHRIAGQVADRIIDFDALPRCLRWAKFGNQTCSSDELKSLATNFSEVIIDTPINDRAFGTYVDFADNVTVQELLDRFTGRENLIQVFDESSSVSLNSQDGWKVVRNKKESESLSFGLVRAVLELLLAEWDSALEVKFDDAVVGTVDDKEIVRSVTVVRRCRDN